MELGLLILCLLALDIAVIWSIYKSNATQIMKFIYTLIILLIPIIGISIYYLFRRNYRMGR